MMTNKEALKLATLWAGKGVHVFPLGPGKVPLANCPQCSDTSPQHLKGCTCADAGRPCHGFHAATTDQDTLRLLFASDKAVCVGIATGASGLVVVDCDTSQDGGKSGAEHYAAALKERGEKLVKTFTVATPSGGVHYFYRSVDADCLAPENRAFPMVDVKTGGSYVVAPGSESKKGTYKHFYGAWPPAEAPQWLVDHLDRPGRLRTSSTDVMVPASSDVKEVSNPDLYLEAAVRNAASAIATAPRGSVYDTIRRKSFSLAPLVRGGSLDLEDVVRELEAAVPSFAANRTQDVRRCLEGAMGKVRAESVVSTPPKDVEEWDALEDDEAPAPLEAAVLAAVPDLTPEPEKPVLHSVGNDEAPEPVKPVAVDLRGRGRCADSFWESTPVLKQIREVARAAGKSPEALLMNTCSILASYVPPTVTVGSVGGRPPASLNHGLVNIAGSGMGKSSTVAMAVKTAGVPTPVYNTDGDPDFTVLYGVSTGEGIMDAFGEYVTDSDGNREYKARASRVRVDLDEGLGMLKALDRPNNILGACLSSLLQGLGYATTASTKVRSMEAGTYRLVVGLNAQAGVLGSMLATKDQGFAQRFFYVNAYPEMRTDEAKGRFGDSAKMSAEEKLAFLKEQEQKLEGRRVSELKGPGGEALADWVQGLPDHVIELPVDGQVDMAFLLDEHSNEGVKDELNSHKPLQMLALYGMLTLLHGSVHPSDMLWENARLLWDAMEDGRKAFQRRALEEEADRRREADNQHISRVTRAKAAEQVTVSEYARHQMRRLRDGAKRTDLTRTKASSSVLDSKIARKLKESGFTRASLIDRAIFEGYLTEAEGVLLPGPKS